ncbi:von Willebrand factor type A [Thalassoporum mexicanum PCC 7367]|uniref:vWA domain-containing protein n=1 Tax=Thalassoporum mexicanum TaxID=3457544 RepID=UPI00029FE01A|nr:VWA domain-containing protein [Pseudanabaena sp. PCC 7367]AFY71330.1 von Willebrand factor type A [Pseudanabaena sp. PCC 7367]
MSVNLSYSLSDRQLDRTETNSQRQLAITVSAGSEPSNVRLNLCLVLDRSGSMGGQPLEIVKKAAIKLLEQMSPQDRISVVAFDHKAKVVVENQPLDNPSAIAAKINSLRASGGTCIDDAIKLGLKEINQNKDNAVSQAFVLTDGENEHGDNQRCLEFARLATEYSITLHTLGFGDHWNQDVLEGIADAGGGTLAYIETPAEAVTEFTRLLHRVQAVGLTNAYLGLELSPNVRLAELKPVAQVAPDTIELNVEQVAASNINPELQKLRIRIGDLMTDLERVILVNLYVNHGQPDHVIPGSNSNAIKLLNAWIEYDNPALGQMGLESQPIAVEADLINDFQPQPDPQVKHSILALAKYRQTQIAEAKLNQGDREGASTMLQSAAKTALQMGDQKAATVLQAGATRLQGGTELSESERKQTRIVSKTVLQPPSSTTDKEDN